MGPDRPRTSHLDDRTEDPGIVLLQRTALDLSMLTLPAYNIFSTPTRFYPSDH